MKIFYKSCSNSIWGMMARSSASDMNVVVCKSKPKALQALASPYFADFHHVSEGMSLVFKKKKISRLDKPRAIGHAISDTSKLYFYQLYDRIMDIFPTNKLCTLDTDGFQAAVTGIPLVQFFDSLQKNKFLFDFGSLDDNCLLFQRHPNLRGYNASRPGRLKVENYMINSMAVIRAKQHSIQYCDENGNVCEKQKCSGIKKSTLAAVTHQDYLNTAINNEQYVLNENGIRSDGESIYMTTTKKRALVNINVVRIFPDKSDINKSYPIGYKGHM